MEQLFYFFSHLSPDLVTGILTLILSALSIIGLRFGITWIKDITTVIYGIIFVLKIIKHVKPMADHYFKTHPKGRQLAKKTDIDETFDKYFTAEQTGAAG